MFLGFILMAFSLQIGKMIANMSMIEYSDGARGLSGEDFDMISTVSAYTYLAIGAIISIFGSAGILINYARRIKLKD